MEALSEVNAVGCIRSTSERKQFDSADFRDSLTWLGRWREELREFCGQPRTKAEIMASVDSLFRPLAVDGLAMMELAGERELADGFRLFQSQAMALFREGDCRPGEIIDQEHVDRITAAYGKLICRRI